MYHLLMIHVTPPEKETYKVVLSHFDISVSLSTVEVELIDIVVEPLSS